MTPNYALNLTSRLAAARPGRLELQISARRGHNAGSQVNACALARERHRRSPCTRQKPDRGPQRLNYPPTSTTGSRLAPPGLSWHVELGKCNDHLIAALTTR